MRNQPALRAGVDRRPGPRPVASRVRCHPTTIASSCERYLSWKGDRNTERWTPAPVSAIGKDGSPKSSSSHPPPRSTNLPNVSPRLAMSTIESPGVKLPGSEQPSKNQDLPAIDQIQMPAAWQDFDGSRESRDWAGGAGSDLGRLSPDDGCPPSRCHRRTPPAPSSSSTRVMRRGHRRVRRRWERQRSLRCWTQRCRR